MSSNLYLGLSWLPKAPAEFVTILKQAEIIPDPGAEFRRLANHALDDNQLGRLGRTIMRAAKKGRSLSPLSPFRLGLLSNGTLDLLVPQLVASAARHGLALECVAADYGQVAQEAFDPESRINTAKPDAVLFALDHRAFPFHLRPGDIE